MAQVADTILSKPRQVSTKGAARRMRASGWVPAVAYGPSQEPRPLAVDPKTFMLARMEHGVAHIYDVKVEGQETFKALIKSVQRDPVSRQLLHVDLYALDMNKPIRLQVRVELVGRPKGAIHGGILQQVQRRVEISCLPKDIPAFIEVDVSGLDLGDTIHLSNLTLPEGVKTTALSDEAVAVLTAPEAEEETAAEGEGEAAAAAEKK